MDEFNNTVIGNGPGGYYLIEKGLWIGLKRKPNGFRRFLMRAVFGWEWYEKTILEEKGYYGKSNEVQELRYDDEEWQVSQVRRTQG